MGCGYDPQDCVFKHWANLPTAHLEPAGVHLDCPVCGTYRAISVNVKMKYGRPYVDWNPWCDPKCARDEVRLKLAATRLGEWGCVSARYKPRHAIDSKDLIELALADIPVSSLRLGLLEMAGLSTAQALAKLGIGPTHKGRTITPLRKLGRLPVLVRNPRSPLLPVLVTRAVTSFGKKPQLKARFNRRLTMSDILIPPPAGVRGEGKAATLRRPRRDDDGQACRTCHLRKPWAEFEWRSGAGKGRRAQCKACDESHPVPGTAAEWIAARFPSREIPSVFAEMLDEAFEAGRRAANLGYGPRGAVK